MLPAHCRHYSGYRDSRPGTLPLQRKSNTSASNSTDPEQNAGVWAQYCESIFNDSIYMKYPKGKSIRTESALVVEDGEGLGVNVVNGYRVFPREWKYSKIDCVMVAQLREYTKNHQIVYFKWTKYKVWELYLNKAVKKNTTKEKKEQLIATEVRSRRLSLKNILKEEVDTFVLQLQERMANNSCSYSLLLPSISKVAKPHCLESGLLPHSHWWSTNDLQRWLMSHGK